MKAALWAVVIAAAASISLALGVRQTFGLFVLPLATEQGISPGLLGASIALHNLAWGLAQPLGGAMGDRYGAGRIISAGGICLALGLAWMALFPGPVSAVLGLGILTGIGVAGAGTGAVLAAVGRAVPPERRGEMIGLASAGGSLGQAAMVPFADQLIGHWGATTAMAGLAVAALCVIPIARTIEWRPSAAAAKAAAGLAGLPALARRALADRDFALLTGGFFACGFQLAFLTVHLPTHLSLCGLPAMGAISLMAVGLFNIPGSWICGRASDYVRPELALGVIYLVRSIAIAVFAATVPTQLGTLVFAAVMGFVWLGTIPLTNAAIARRFGLVDLGALYGVCFLSHQIGGFLGAGAGAMLIQYAGNYDAFWPVMVVVGISATAMNWMARPPARAMA